MTALLAAYVRIGKSSHRLSAGLLALPALYYLAGPVANLAAVLIVVWEMQRGELRWYTSLLLLAETLLLSSASVWMGMMGSFRLAMLPDAYLDPLLQDKKIYIPWIAFFASTVLTLLFKKRLGFLARNPLPWTGVQFLVLVLAGYGLIHQSRDKSLEKLEELNYYMQKERWNDIITSASEATENPEVTSYLNLALARNGELGEKLFFYQQSDFKSLIPEWDFTPFTSALLSNIHFCMNNVASAQKYAFEGNLTSISEGCPNLLQRLVETNLIYGAYPVAEKYINLLEQTLFYKKWASSRRKFLRNDTLVESDPLLGNKRRSLFNADKQPAESSVLVDVLEKLAINNPSDQSSMQYLTSILLVNRDLTRFKSLLEKHYGTRVWPGLTRSQQEAVLAISPDAAYGWAHGVSYATGERFDEFRKASYDNQGGADPNEAMSGFKDTFWYFLLFTKQ
jgi:hypothetical protein